MQAPAAEFADMQGLLRSGYGGLVEAAFLLLRITDIASARAWLADAPVTTAAERNVSRALQIAVTAEGIRAIGVEEGIVARFSPEFVSGMAGLEGRSRRLGDVGANEPTRWRWGAKRPPDALVMLYARADLASWRASVLDERFRRGFTVLEDLPTSDMGGHEPFGFADGVSQPRADWTNEREPGGADDLGYGNLIAPGEFVLGYRNEYGLYTDRPLLDPAEDGTATLPAARDDPARRDLGHNGTYLVFRELRQDVLSFWRFVAANARPQETVPGLAEAMVGRRMSGEPILSFGSRPIRGVGPDPIDIRRNQFDYAADPEGQRCPLGAHVRRTNPRTGDMPGGRQNPLSRLWRTLGFSHPDLREDLVASSRFHRILRRGREFGRMLPWRQVLAAGAEDPECGLHFICLNASIARQFEFIQNSWLMSSKFAGLSGESDPLTGNRIPLQAGEATDGVGLAQPNGIARRLSALPQFVTVAGGAYFFLPGVRALRYLSGVRV